MRRQLLPLLLAATALAAPMRSQQAANAHQPIVYVFAGQSNVEFLGLPSPTCATAPARANVVYHGLLGGRGGAAPLVLTPPIPFAPQLPLMEVGERLGRHHPDDLVVVVLLARAGSALLMRNASVFAPREAWVDPLLPSNPGALLRRLGPALTQIAQMLPRELHIVWGQGESDCAARPARPPSADEYAKEVQYLFADLATAIGVNSYDVHLVTLGSILSPAQPPAAVDAIREAYFAMERAPMPIPGKQVRIASVAHHYDLPHPLFAPGLPDIYHLDPCGYVELARRIGAGIAEPGSLPRVRGLSLSGDTRLQVTATVPLVSFPATTTVNHLFELEIGGVVETAFTVECFDDKLSIDLPTLPKPAPALRLRYIVGSGYGANWPSSALRTPAGLPLEPFVLTR